ncbi:BZ3500_MvSof-1268-A1-R1_Chr3-1g05439 [Microbotryum saponariae]|uniref:BZ3500_MvSof-1268-A1-R1_Chr3-1g05439 protein n=1 Tax=Microbotryum saponariae TaxID=289078 RepID=A0A2X0KWP6_9BASI|nr:BZ3500_MvSof-1268-A1-R1_Chr3-1g05439 [Microbotryum saponariae]SDA04630.1 BZ3501_MvSof-1269-A2-R1_Chr3-1g05110 [Microbotryum saponariae]
MLDQDDEDSTPESPPRLIVAGRVNPSEGEDESSSMIEPRQRDDTPFTSTPLPASAMTAKTSSSTQHILRSKELLMTSKSTTSTATTGSNRTVVPLNPSTRFNQHLESDSATQHQTMSDKQKGTQPLVDETSVIESRHSGGFEGQGFTDEDEMVVLSSGSGTESDRPFLARASSFNRPSQLHDEDHDDQDLTTSSSAASSFTADNEIDSPVATRAQPEARQRAVRIANNTSPERERRAVLSSIIDSPELGRRGSMDALSKDSFPSLSNLSTPHANYSHNAYSNAANADPRTPLGRLYATPTGSPDSVEGFVKAILPPSSSPAAVRRAQHVLTTLKSTSKPILKKGTPHPQRYRGRQLVDTPLSVALQKKMNDVSPGEERAVEEEEEDSIEAPHLLQDESTSSSNDLTTLHRGNTSLPSGGATGFAVAGPGTRVDRFDHVKLNAYLHQFNGTLTAENVQLTKNLGDKTKENEQLRKEVMRLREISSMVGGSRVGDDTREEEGEGNSSRVEAVLNGLVEGRNEGPSRRVQELEELVDRLQNELEDKDRQLVEREDRTHVTDAGDERRNFKVELEEKVAENEQLASALEDARSRVDELLTELENQEAGFAQKNSELNQELCTIMEKQDSDLQATREQLTDARQEIERLQVKAGDDSDRHVVLELKEEIRRLQHRVDELESTVEQKEVELDDLKKKQENLTESESELKRQVAEQLENVQQIEEALNESAQQLVQHEDELESLKVQLAAEKNVNSTLSAQISQLKLPKAKSPLANEVYNSNKDSIIGSLEEELQVAQQEVRDLKQRLQQRESREEVEVQQLKIRTLESQKRELEDRVSSLKSQVTMTFGSPKRNGSTPDRSNLFRSIIGLQTPKTPGQMLGNITAWSPGSAADETIQPLYSHMQELVQLVDDLREQLAATNEDVDKKLNQLEISGSGTIALARDLAQARARIVQLEAELERLLGANGSLERVRTRLMSLSCPGCEHVFDATKIVRLRVDKSGLTFEESETSPKVSESLRSALAGVNVKLSQLESENAVLVESSSRARDLAADKSALAKQLSALQKDFAQARSEIVGLEVDLQTERNRLKGMADEQASLRTAKGALEARLNTTETELRALKSSSRADPSELAQLRADKSSLLDERAALVAQLGSIDSQTHRVATSLNAKSSAQASIPSQLDQFIAEIARLKNSLNEKETASRSWRDERSDILRNVAGLQMDLVKVREDAVSLGMDLANVRRERDALGGGELAQALLRIESLEKRIRDHTCASSTTATSQELKARHAKEAKGLLVMIRYLKLRVSRELAFRNDLTYQKEYLQAMVKDKQATIDLVMSQLSLPPSSPPSDHRPWGSKPTLKAAVLAVISLRRMSRASQQWREASRGKDKLRNEAYPAVRGKAFVPSTTA